MGFLEKLVEVYKKLDRIDEELAKNPAGAIKSIFFYPVSSGIKPSGKYLKKGHRQFRDL
ncbi:hypothetical protein [Pyrococcus kukulkanii]|uniref:Uncharacterized protein n=1 Tax=Pyrococcus kukulkanii TaxID=1609559 RepID=A0ABV4T5Z7_9EURY